MAVRVRITRIGAKLSQSRFMDMTQQLAVLSLTHTEGCVLGSNHTPRSNSPASTHSGSSPGTSQGKASMDIERNTRPVPDKFRRSASRELFLTSPSRRMASIPSSLPSHLDMDRPISSTFPDGSDSYASIASFQASARSTESASGPLSSSSCAETTAALTAATYSTPQSTSEHQPPAALPLSHLLPTSTHFSPHQRTNTAPQQQLTSRVEALDASSLNILLDGQDAPLPPIERASNHPASLTLGFPPIRTTTSRPAPTPLPAKFSIDGVSARLSPAIITRRPQHPILSLPPISITSAPANDSRRLRSGSLRSVPALPMEGSDDREPAEHDNADLDDLDEEDEGVIDGDESSEEEIPEAELPDMASEDGECSSSSSGPPLRRRLSMPTFGPSTEPTPYPAFQSCGPSSTIQIEPRDEEGCEHLPHYTNDIYLRAILPRKMEFTAPGVQARDRKWRRTLCILEGTAFRVYRCPPTASGKGLIGNLWEKTVGMGDTVTQSTQMGSTTANERESKREVRQTKLDGPSPTSSPMLPPASRPSQLPNDSDSEDQAPPSSTRLRLLPSNFRKKNRAASDGPSTSPLLSSPPHQIALKSISSQGFVRPPNLKTESDPATPVLGGASPTPTPRMPRTKRRHLWVDDPAVPFPQEQDLLYAYRLHAAESGLASDYLKRRNVIRVRMEGQQFLLQARDVASVVDWIEVRPFSYWAGNS